MKKPSAKNISDILQNSSLARIVQRANTLHDLDQKIQKIFPEHYCGLYRMVNLVDNQLIFEVQNATVRYGLQLQQAELLSLIQQILPEINRLQFNVNPNFNSLEKRKMV